MDESAGGSVMYGTYALCTCSYQTTTLASQCSIMTVTVFPSMGDSPDLTLLNTARLFTRLEHNLLSPGSEVRTLRGSEFQRRRITKNVEYARTLLSQLERSLPQLKSLDQRHEAQAEITRDRQLLKQMQIILDEEAAQAPDLEDAEESEWNDLFSKPVAEVPPAGQPQPQSTREQKDVSTATSLPTPTPTSTLTQTPTATPAPTLRNRNQNSAASKPQTAKASGASTATSPKQEKEQELSTHRLEQEDLTSSLLSLAGQLKASSQSFQATLENEQSVLDRAVTGMDKTTTTMEAAGKRMGMLRKMSEGKGWWGRMMLYAWIFGLWVVAILIVYVGPKLRF